MIARFIAILILLSLSAAAGGGQEIRFNCSQASEAFIIWGVNGWQKPAAAPAGSWEKDGVTYSPMHGSDGDFFVTLPAAEGDVLDYVFWITKGPLEKGTDVWDKNPQSKDYHTRVSAGTIALVESHVDVTPAQPLTPVDFGGTALIISAVVCALLLFALRRNREKARFTPHRVLLAATLSLMLLLTLTRASVAGISWRVVADWRHGVPQMLWASCNDLFFAAAVGGGMVLLAWLLRFRKRASLAVMVAGLLFLLISGIAAVANIRVVDMLGKPFNYQWLYYSDFLRSEDARAALSAQVDAGYVRGVLSVVFAAGLLTVALIAAFSLAQPVWLKRSGVVAALLIAGYFVVAPSHAQALGVDRDRLSNPVVAFLSSVNPFGGPPALFTMQLPDSVTYREPAHRPPHKTEGIRNVLVVVLESTPAEYVQPYDTVYKVTPNIGRLSEGAILGRQHYAHAPATNLGMVSLLTSVYPWLSYNSFTEEHPDMKVPSLASELHDSGYRTAFFNSGDNGFQKAGEFLSHRGFDAVTDRTSSCGNAAFEPEADGWEHMGGKPDACTFSQLREWIDSDTSKPFMAVLWTYQTHYPYFSNGSAQRYAADEFFNRYLNALHEADSLVGSLYDHLRETGLDKSTLVVIVGDHGEAFGRHNQTTHGREIYEENVHIPCIIVNPSLDAHEIAFPSGMVDVAPTVMDLLGRQSPPAWEGESLLAKGSRSRTYFFAPWSDYLFGYREGDRKFIYNATRDETEVYDLRSDPLEARPVAVADAEAQAGFEKLSAWAQHVNAVTEKIIGKSAQ